MRYRSSRRTLAIGLLATLSLLGAACSRSGSEAETGTGATTPSGGTSGTGGSASTSTTAAADRLDQGSFGDLTHVCQDGDASGATDTGVTDTEIHVGTITDKGYTGRPGLDVEMFDAATAFAAWCNEHGGILGRQIVVDDRDAALTQYTDRINESCDADLALVGGGAVFDDGDNGARIACGLPNIPGYVVSPVARVADLQVQPLPNPVNKVNGFAYRAVARQFPQDIGDFGVLTTSIGSTLAVAQADVEQATQLGYTTVYNEEYDPLGESDWRPFVVAMRDAGVKVFEFVGEPENGAQLMQAMQVEGYFPDVILYSANFYTDQFPALAGDTGAPHVFIRTQFTPFEDAADNPATADYLEMMQRYDPSGKVALLGAQAMSAYLLFAQAATACGSTLTRACLLQNAGSVTNWTAGGLHAPQDPSNNAPSTCQALLTFGADGYHFDDAVNQPNQGIFNCDPANLLTLTGDYGV